MKRPYFSSSVNNNDTFIRMKTHHRDRQALYWGESEELEPERDYGKNSPSGISDVERAVVR